MRKRILQELFCSKITFEVVCFKKRMVKKKPEKILANAYRIHCMLSIYEMLMEKSQDLDGEVLRILLLVPDVLTLFYNTWMNRNDSFLNELNDCIQDETAELLGISQELEIVI